MATRRPARRSRRPTSPTISAPTRAIRAGAGSCRPAWAWPPVALGGAAYVGELNPSTSSNWPSSADQVSFTFNYSQQAVTIAAGHRLGVRIWFKENASTSIDVLYDNANYPTQLQLNSES